MDQKLKNLTEYSGVKVSLSADFSKLTTMRLNAIGNLIEIDNTESLKKVLIKLNKEKIKYKILGWGANSLISDKKIENYIKLNFNFDENEFSTVKDLYFLPASVPLSLLTRAALKLHLSGWECLTGIPATVGGAVYMNAGTKFGEISEIIKYIDIMDQYGEIRRIDNSEELFSYRKNNFIKKGDVIIAAGLKHRGVDSSVPDKINEYMKYRKETQPLSTKNCGCVFKNPKELGAGLIIDRLGLKDFQYKNLKVSEKHANFIENHGPSNLEDFNTIVTMIKSTILLYTGKKIECEVQYNYNKSNDELD